MLASADIHINGGKPWDIQVLDERLYSRIIRHGSLGLGEAYVGGSIICFPAQELFVQGKSSCGKLRLIRRG